MAEELFQPNMWKLRDLLEGNTYKVPVYQRPYSWDRSEVKVLFDDILEAYKSDKPKTQKEGYYVGNIIIYKKGEELNGLIPKYDIIDGQQRITTFVLMFLAIYTLMERENFSFSIPAFTNIKSCLWKNTGIEYSKDLKTLELNSIEKEKFKELYDECFDNPENILDFFVNNAGKTVFEKRVISNFEYIYERLESEILSKGKDELRDFAHYLLNFVVIISIKANTKENKVFSMFESLNSKGKKLEEIDLIKTYIFSRLDEKHYSKYLDRWGELIIRTGDRLEDYLYVYIKAYIKFYKQSIKINNFKTTIVKKLIDFFGAESEEEALMKLLDDMYLKVDYYNLLYSSGAVYKLIKNHKLRFYYELFVDLQYQHPKPVFFRLFIELKNKQITKDEVFEIILDIISFNVKFLTIGEMESKEAIDVYNDIIEDTYEKEKIDRDYVLYRTNKELLPRINEKELKRKLTKMDMYSSKRKLSKFLLSLYEATEIDSYGNYKTSYDEAYHLVMSYPKTINYDHLLPQNPKISSKYKYYKGANEELILKENHDFPDNIYEGMNYEDFQKEILNKIGNLRLYYKDKNSRRQNSFLKLKEYKNFYSYRDIEKRGEEISEIIFEHCLPKSKNIRRTGRKQKNPVKEKNYDLPKIKEMISLGIVKPGVKLYIPDVGIDSQATLLNDGTVEYKNKKMSLNKWGLEVTEWSSINIYRHTRVKYESETLQDKRERYNKKK